MSKEKELEVWVFLFTPGERHSAVSPMAYSPKLLQHLKEQGFKIKEQNWRGSLDTLPKNLALVRVSTHMSIPELNRTIEKCHSLGHVVFYDDQHVTPEFTFEPPPKDFEELMTAVDKMLAATHTHTEKEKLVTY